MPPPPPTETQGTRTETKIEITLFDPSNAAHAALLPALADIHIACIASGTVTTFVPPLNRDKIIEWWRARAADVQDGSRVIFMAFADSDAEAEAEAEADSEVRLAGYVILHRPRTETMLFRGEVEKLLVSPDFRRRGIAWKLMQRLEADAQALGQTLLMLETTTGGAAETLYEKLGYNRLGVIPNSGVSPVDGSLVSGTFYWKQL
ncbi:acyl-CoA N-acyltransferase [Mycena rebaudengoi]|nr:acyl-CoA N-acyltransferase [Mycena rebaudengoi]